MAKIILIHANCHSSGLGDYSFAGHIAKDIARIIAERAMHDTKVILVSEPHGVEQFIRLYGEPVDGLVLIEGIAVGLSSLDAIDVIDNSVIAYVDVARCRPSADDSVLRVLAPESKLIFLGHAHWDDSYVGPLAKIPFLHALSIKHPGVYDFFFTEDCFLGCAGFGDSRLGFHSMTKTSALPDLSEDEEALIPVGDFGFMYLSSKPGKDYPIIAQFMKLCGKRSYMLVGNFTDKNTQIQDAYDSDTTLVSAEPFPLISYQRSVPNSVMRRAMARSTSPLVLSTGLASTLEAMNEGKLPFYQDLKQNAHFVASYLVALKKLIDSEPLIPDLVFKLAKKLFAPKPLSATSMERTRNLLSVAETSTALARLNSTLIEKANGSIAPRLLGFLEGARKTKDNYQLLKVLDSLKKDTDTGRIDLPTALFRAVANGFVFELRVVIRAIKARGDSLDYIDASDSATALHLAVQLKQRDCARLLIASGISLNAQNSDLNTPLHIAAQHNDLSLVELLMRFGASVEPINAVGKTPQQCATEVEVQAILGGVAFMEFLGSA